MQKVMFNLPAQRLVLFKHHSKHYNCIVYEAKPLILPTNPYKASQAELTSLDITPEVMTQLKELKVSRGITDEPFVDFGIVEIEAEVVAVRQVTHRDGGQVTLLRISPTKIKRAASTPSDIDSIAQFHAEVMFSVNDVVECAKRILREPKKIAGDMDLLISELVPVDIIKAIADGRIWRNHLKELTNGLSEIIATNGCPPHMLNLFDDFLREWIPRLQEERMTFSELLRDALQKDEKGTVSLYDTFVEICRKWTKNLTDIEIRYQNLRNNGYVVRDETDICIYVTKVAAKHSPKFKWLYDNLFREFPAVFQREIDLVVWGCGCGLDLLALYDQAMQQNNPQLWLSVRSVTLIDISPVARQRAMEIAEVLFPMARGKITTCHCDFKDSSSIPLEIPRSFIYTPRLHLVSNVIDLLSGDQLRRFAQMQKASCARSCYGKSYFNEMFLAFSPEYKNWDWDATRSKMDKYRQIWGEKTSDMIVGGGAPDKCAYATFSRNDCSRSLAYQAYYDGNRCLRSLVLERNRCLDEGADDKALKGLQKTLFNIIINGKGFFDCYEWVDVQTRENRQGENCIDRLLFVPFGNIDIPPCLVVFFKPRDALDIKNKAWKELFKKVGLENSDFLRPASVTKTLIWRNGLLAGDIDYSQYRMENAQDFSEAFVVNPHGAKPLPDVDKEMDKKQRDVIFGRAQLRRIRGGAGCGKTTTMLWHSVMSILRTHQPVLVACKTVTLFSHNQRRMAATILAQVPGLNCVERKLVQFKTIDKYLCEYNKDMNSCDMSFCGRCRRRFNREMERNNEVDPGRIVPVACGTGNAKLPKCVLLENHGRNQHALVHDLDASEKDLLCKSCKKKLVDALCRKDRAVLSKAESFGAVMVDEIQSVGPDLVQALYNLTEEGNPYREFYAFCDERQCLETEAVETDTRVKKLRVKTPKGGDGRQFRGDWFGLSKPYRQLGELSGVLSEVAKTFQKSTDVKYGKDETEYPPYNGLTGAFSVLIAQNCPNSLCEEVLKAINHLKGIGETRITVVCDSVPTVHSLFRNVNEPNWLSTHKPGATFLEEQKLRNDFEETEDHIGLTTIQHAQGWDLDCVILVITQNKDVNAHQVDSVLTGITRAKKQLRIIDASSTHWVYEHLKRFN